MLGTVVRTFATSGSSTEVYQVINAQLLELQHNGAQVGPQDLWVGLLLQVPTKGSLCVQPEALSRLSAPSTASPLVSTCLQRRASFNAGCDRSFAGMYSSLPGLA